MKKVYIIFITSIELIALTIYGCISHKMFGYPGYMVSIEGKNMSVRDIGIMEKTIKERDFAMVEERNKGERCDLYSKYISSNKQIKHSYIKIVVCYSKEESADRINNFKMLVINAWEGNDPSLKGKIDSIGDVLYAELKKTVGDNNIKIERNTTGPPF